MNLLKDLLVHTLELVQSLIQFRLRRLIVVLFLRLFGLQLSAIVLGHGVTEAVHEGLILVTDASLSHVLGQFILSIDKVLEVAIFCYCSLLILVIRFNVHLVVGALI